MKDTLMRHILEVRLENRMFSFLDFRGEMVDKLKSSGYKRFKLSSSERIEAAKGDFSQIAFFSWENFGFQIDGAKNFENFREGIERIFHILEDFQKYNISNNKILRIGTKSCILSVQDADSFKNIKQKYKDLMFKNYSSLESKIHSSLLDVGYVFNDWEREEGKINILNGPVTKEEATIRFFDQNPIYNSFKKDFGIYCAIDFYQENPKLNSELDKISEQCIVNITEIEKIHKGFIEYFYE